jgi:hypothetical protein
MGQEINQIRFSPEDFRAFEATLAEESDLLRRELAAGRFAATGYVGGFELESWLVDHNYFPAPINEAYLARLNDPLVVPELSKFNVELNGTPQPLLGQALSRMEAELTRTWQRCLDVAHELDASLVMIGILPTIHQSQLVLENVSPLNRYHALNEQVLQQRAGKPIRIAIDGRERLDIQHHDVMLEAATTSFQVHLQTPAREALRYYNASIVLSAPIVAACANSPFLFGKYLWDETRIPLFEQAVDLGGFHGLDDPERRVTFGSGYLIDSPYECFEENLRRYPVLLPIHFDTPPQQFAHVRLHNGTIWRWNRMLIGFDDARTPHLRIEHRVIPSGPSIVDQIANAAIYLGLAHFHAQDAQAPEARLSFDAARDNFYRAARDGLSARLTWLDGVQTDARTLLLDELIPQAVHALKQLGIDRDEAEHYLGIVRSRVAGGQTGAAWQRAFMDKSGAEKTQRDFLLLSAAYLREQRSGKPVHEWDL